LDQKIKVKKNFKGSLIYLKFLIKKGKTALKNRLIGSCDEKSNKKAFKMVQNEKKESEMTHGVEIEVWKNPKTNTLFSLWDFA
jgi:hypothetical protein